MADTAKVVWNNAEAGQVISRLISTLMKPDHILTCPESFLIAEIDKIQRHAFKKDRQRTLTSCKSLASLGRAFEVVKNLPWIHLKKVKWHKYDPVVVPTSDSPPAVAEAAKVVEPLPVPAAEPVAETEKLLPRLLAEVSEMFAPAMAKRLVPIVDAMIEDQIGKLREEWATELLKIMYQIDNKVDKTIAGSALDSRMSVKPPPGGVESISAANNSGTGLIATQPLKKRVFVSNSDAASQNTLNEYGETKGLKLVIASGSNNSGENKSLKQILKNGDVDMVIIHTSNISHTKFDFIRGLIPHSKIRMVQTPADIREAMMAGL